MALLAGLRGYAIAAFAALFLATATAAFSYRTAYVAEHAKREAAQAELARAVQAADELRRTADAQATALLRAQEHSRSLADQRSRQRDTILNAKPDEDGPAAPVLRDAVSGGVRRP